MEEKKKKGNEVDTIAIYSTSKNAGLRPHLPLLLRQLAKRPNLGTHKAKMYGAACAAFQKRSHFYSPLKSNSKSKLVTCKCFNFQIASKHLIPMRQICSLSSESNTESSACLRELHRIQHDFCSEGLILGAQNSLGSPNTFSTF